MTSIAKLAQVTATCQRDRCGDVFTPTIQQLNSGGGLYCSKNCAFRARGARQSVRRGLVCDACREFGDHVFTRYHLRICVKCCTCAWATCWSKVPYTSDPGTLAASDSGHLTSYRCPLCPWWHLTSHTADVAGGIPADYAARQVKVARLLAEQSFDIDRYRTRTFDRFKKS